MTHKTVTGTRPLMMWGLIAIIIILVVGFVVGLVVIYPNIQEEEAAGQATAQAHTALEQHYQAGLAFETAEEWAAAKAEYIQVISLDAGYKDVQARLVAVKEQEKETRAAATATAMIQVGQAHATAAVAPTAAAPAAATLSPLPLPTNTPIVLFSEESPQNWEGIYRENSGRDYPMVLYIERISGNSFSGKLHWPDLRNSITAIRGEIVRDFEGFVEQSKWQLVQGFDPQTSEIGLKFTETDMIQGSGIALNGWYYALLQDDKTMNGVWFRSEERSESSGSFTIYLDK